MFKYFFVLLLFQLVFSQVQEPELLWEYSGCYSSWCERGWYSSPAVDSEDGVVYASAYSVWKIDLATGEVIWTAPSKGCVGGSADTSVRTWAGIVLADIHGNGKKRIVVAQGDGWLNVLDTDGKCDTNFPIKVCDSELRSLAVKDIDDDGYMEIVVGEANDHLNTYIYNHGGSLLSNWPQKESETAGYAHGVFDDNIGLITVEDKEYIFVPSDVHYIMAYTLDGEPIPANEKFPKETWGECGIHLNEEDDIRGYASCSNNAIRPNFADSPINYVEIDGENRIVVIGNEYDCGTDNYEPQFLSPYIFNIDRTRFVNSKYNWTVVPQTKTPIEPNYGDYNKIESISWKPVTVDIDGGDIEIIFPASDGCLHVYNLDKTEPYNWPYCIGTSSNVKYFSEPVVADLDNDGYAEIIVTSWGEKESGENGNLFVFNYKGEVLYSIELPDAKSDSWNGGLAAPSLGKLDGGEGDVVIVVNTAYAGVCAYTIPETSDAEFLWKTGRGNLGRYGNSEEKMSNGGGTNTNTTSASQFVTLFFSLNLILLLCLFI
ncbi:protein defective in exine formation [Anaeramoeba flamelloides]|uniref:Protein defective in exine formation n=1 Tax=Anaeramoeba flamelloides TaxID=1746091 RepID=A0AAV7ZF88_9EUKA|nr:protein defective in exine formation [Anaeramoeba flamelloides]